MGEHADFENERPTMNPLPPAPWLRLAPARGPGRPPVETGWFSWRMEPGQQGVYRHDVPRGECFSFWNGVSWCLRATTPEEALRNRCWPFTRPSRVSWRGLKNKPRAR